MKALAYVFVSLCWTVSPLVKRRVVDYMSLADVTDDDSPVRTFVALFSVVSSIILCLMAIPTPYRAYTAAMPAEAWTLLLAGAAAGCAASTALVALLRDGNPGLTMLYLNATASLASYVWGALIYGKLTLDGVGGACLIVAGTTLTRSS